MSHTVSSLKRKLKTSLIDAGSKALNFFPNFYFPSSEGFCEKEGQHYCIFYLSSHGSLGDAAMGYSIISQILKKYPDARISVLVHLDTDKEHFSQYGVEVVSIEGYFSVIPSRSAAMKISRILETCTNFIIPGADVLDGVYSKGSSFRRLFAGLMAEKRGAKVHVVGFSFSDRAPEVTRRLFRDRCQSFSIVCRDPISADRLGKVMGREIPYGADLAFLLPVGETSLHPSAQAAEQVVERWRSENRPIVAFNANPLSFQNSLPDLSRRKVVEALSSALDDFASRTGAAILFLTHDNRKSFSDARLSSEIIDSLKTNFPRHFLSETVQPTDIKRLCKMSDLVVTGRMHLGIAGLGAGKTTMITDYQGKVRGLYALFETPDLALDLGEIVQPGRLSALMEETLRERKVYEKKIQDHLPKIEALSRKNLESVWE